MKNYDAIKDARCETLKTAAEKVIQRSADISVRVYKYHYLTPFVDMLLYDARGSEKSRAYFHPCRLQWCTHLDLKPQCSLAGSK